MENGKIDFVRAINGRLTGRTICDKCEGRGWIAYDAGGAKTLTKEGVTSILFPEQTKESLVRALEQFKTKTWDRTVIREFARGFSQDVFRSKIQATVESAYDDFKNGKRDRFFS